MQRWLLQSKLHRTRVTGTEKDYEGHIAIDSDLIEAADIAVGERVQVVNVTSGERFVTDTIAGEAGQIEVNGAATRLAEPGDVVIVLSYDLDDSDEPAEPTVLLPDAANAVVETR